MAKVEVREVPQSRGYSLELYHEGVHIGEYEQSWASEESGDRAAKVGEAERASDLLLDAYRRHGGKIKVRWNGKPGVPRHLRKEIRPYLGTERLDTIPPHPYWRKP